MLNEYCSHLNESFLASHEIRLNWHHVTLLLERTNIPSGKNPASGLTKNVWLFLISFRVEIAIGLKCSLDFMLLVRDETMKMKEEIIRDCWVFLKVIYRRKEILEIRKLFKYQWQSHMETIQNRRLEGKKRKIWIAKNKAMKEGKVNSKGKKTKQSKKASQTQKQDTCFSGSYQQQGRLHLPTPFLTSVNHRVGKITGCWKGNNSH